VSTYTVTAPIETAPAAMVPGWTVPQSYSVQRRERAERIIEPARERVPAEVFGAARLLTGHAGPMLAQASSDVDLLVRGSRGYGPLRAVLLGGVSSELARSSACPLLVVPRGSVGAFAAQPAIATTTEEVGS
jgi:nucleotide-binding universal stress UspA family protein